MNGYSEINKIYFSIGSKTAFACLLENNARNPKNSGGDARMIVSSYKGEPPYKAISGKFSRLAREFHAAEHQVYNSFKHKIKTLKLNTKLNELAKYIPSLEEVKQSNSFNFFCGTTFVLSSSISMIVFALPNLFRFQNTNPVFMMFWLIISLSLALALSYLIQKTFFLAPPQDYQLVLAREALKEAIKYD